jgi:CRISPR-associated endonuclease Cas3-HD
MPNFYAHSPNDNGNGRWEPYKEHASDVANKAKMFADKFGCGDEAYLAGWYHDTGKLSFPFDNRLKGVNLGYKLDHSTSGALYLMIKYARNSSTGYRNFLGVCNAIVGHHVGINGGTKTALQNHLKDSLKIVAPKNYVPILGKKPDLFVSITDTIEIEGYLKSHNIPPPIIPQTLFYNSEAPDKLNQMLRQRILLSCLCDADVLATKEHFAGDKIVPRRCLHIPQQPKFQEALKLLHDYVKKVKAQAQANPAILKGRDELFEAAKAAGQSNIGMFTMSAPTGLAKTLAMIEFALEHAIKHGMERVIMVVPYLNILDQTASILKEMFKSFGEGYVLEHHSLNFDRTSPKERDLAENWDAPFIITTNVQLLQTLFTTHPGTARKLHNLYKAVILLDEAQNMPYHVLIQTMAALSQLTVLFRSTIVFSTATQPHFDLLAPTIQKYHNNFSLTEIAPKHLFNIPSIKNRVKIDWDIFNKKKWSDLAVEITAKLQVLCIVNMKQHAKNLYLIVHNYYPDATFHLSTDMCKYSRWKVLKKVKERLKKGLRCYLIATQCIEAGEDISFPNGFRAFAPLYAILQASGRVNRHGILPTCDFKVFLPEKEFMESLYPDGSYKFAADVTWSLLSDSNWKADIFDEAVVKDFFNRLYKLNDPAAQDESVKLDAAINDLDFRETQNRYKVIPNEDGINILVNYRETVVLEDGRVIDCGKLHDELKVEADKYGITKKWIAKARPLCVSAFMPQEGSDLEQSIKPLPFLDKNRQRQWSDEWYEHRGRYDNALGIMERGRKPV